MTAEIFESKLSGEITARASKSYAHRALIAAALSDGESFIKNIELNDDIKATIMCLENLGAIFEYLEDAVKVKGINFTKKKEELSLFCNESGSTLRFLIPLSLVFSENTEFSGSKRLLERPQSVYEELFKEKNCYINRTEDKIVVGGELESGIYKCKGDVSSQFLTGLLFTLPLLEGDSTILLTTPLQSVPYVNLTIEVLALFGVNIQMKSENEYFIKGEQTYNPVNISCEGDWSNSAFLEAFNLIGGEVILNGLNEKSAQGDKIYREYFEKLKNGMPVLDITDYPDLAPILMTMASVLNGAELIGTSRLKIKESDRGVVMKNELSKFGADITLYDNKIIVKKSELSKPKVNLNGNNDHRIAMSLSVISSVFGGILENAECVNKSYPLFFEDVKKIGLKFKLI